MVEEDADVDVDAETKVVTATTVETIEGDTMVAGGMTRGTGAIGINFVLLLTKKMHLPVLEGDTMIQEETMVIHVALDNTSS